MGDKHATVALVATCGSLLLSGAAVAADEPLGAATALESSADKSSYYLVKPTPRALMREMSTDRPDTTESPHTVDAGHFQLEMDAVSMARDQGVTDVAMAALNLKLGLASWADQQLVFEPFHHMQGQSGIGDLTLRTKFNLWGNDEGATAFALMPFISLPTASKGFGSGYVEGGLIAPLGLEGPAGFELATMLELDAVRRASKYGADLVATGTAGHAVWKDLGGFMELAATCPLDGDEPVAVGTNAGLTLGVTDDVVVDTGVRLGLTDAAEDLSLFIGGSARY